MPALYGTPRYNSTSTSWLPGGDRNIRATGMGELPIYNWNTSWLPGGDRDPRAPDVNYPVAPSPSRYSPGYSVGGGQLSADPGQNFATGKFLLSDYWKKAAETAGSDISALRENRLSFNDAAKSATEGLKTANTTANRYMDTWMSPDKISGRYDTANLDWQTKMNPLLAEQRKGVEDYVTGVRGVLGKGEQDLANWEATRNSMRDASVSGVLGAANLRSLQTGGAPGMTGSALAAYAGRGIGDAYRQSGLDIGTARLGWRTGAELPSEANILQAKTGQSRYEGDIATKYWGVKNAQTDALASHAARAAQMAPDQARQYLMSLNIAPQQMQQLMAAEMDLRNGQYQMAQRGEETYVYPKQMPFLNASRTQGYLYPNDTLNRYG